LLLRGNRRAAARLGTPGRSGRAPLLRNGRGHAPLGRAGEYQQPSVCSRSSGGHPSNRLNDARIGEIPGGEQSERGSMDRQTVVTSDDHKLGTVIEERDSCVIIETGHVFKTKHAIPRDFLHEQDGTLRATVNKEVVDDSPKVDLDNWDCSTIRLHYGLDGVFV